MAADLGAMIVLKERNTTNIELSISRIIEANVRKEMIKKMTPLKKPNGSMEMSLWLNDQLSS